jgi:4'-phosphopantetheinyl transferase
LARDVTTAELADVTFPELRPREVHVWQAACDDTAEVFQTFLRILSPDELMRVRRLAMREDRRRFVVARGLLRTLVAAATGSDAFALRFTTGPHGKPGFVGPVFFNVAHSGGQVLVALSREHPVGVDVECVRDDIARPELAGAFCTIDEQDLVERLGDPAFFALWTLKEAWCKMTGEGLGAPLSATRIARCAADLEVGARFVRPLPEPVSFVRLDAGERYAAAVAMDGTSLAVHQYAWTPPTTSPTRCNGRRE